MQTTDYISDSTLCTLHCALCSACKLGNVCQFWFISIEHILPIGGVSEPLGVGLGNVHSLEYVHKYILEYFSSEYHRKHVFSCPGQLNNWHCWSEPTNNQSLWRIKDYNDYNDYNYYNNYNYYCKNQIVVENLSCCSMMEFEWKPSVETVPQCISTFSGLSNIKHTW